MTVIPLQLGGLNSMLAGEISPSLPVVSKLPTLIMGMDVSHGSPGMSDIPSIAAVKYYNHIFLLILHFFSPFFISLDWFSLNIQVVSSRQWPSISRYRACVRTQSPKVEMIDSLYKRVSDTEDDGIMRCGFRHTNLKSLSKYQFMAKYVITLCNTIFLVYLQLQGTTGWFLC